MSGVLPLSLAPFEEFMLVDDRPGYRMTFLVEQTFDGEIDRDAFEIGVTEASQRHPLLCAFVKRRWFGGWNWISAGDTRPAIDWAAHDQPVDYPAETGIDLAREVGVRFYARVGNGQSRLVTQFHHSCCDGMGAIQYLSDLFAGYTRHLYPHAAKHPEYQPVKPTALLHRANLPVHRDATMPWFRLFLRTLAYAWKYGIHAPMPLARAAENSESNTTLAYPGTLTRTLSPTVQRSLRQAARRYDVTVNELLVRELMLTLRDWNQRHTTVKENDQISIMVPTNLRNLDHDQMPAANVMGSVAFQRSLSEMADSDKLLASIKEESQFYKKWRYGAAVLDGLKVLRWLPGSLRLILNRKRSISTAMLSCIGDPSLAISAIFPVNADGNPIFGNLVFEDLNTAPPIRPLSHASFTTWHFSNKLRLGVRCDAEVFSQESAQELLDLFTERVVALACADSEARTDKRQAA